MCGRSVGTGTPVRGIENQLARTKLDFHNMQISIYQFVEKVFDNLQHRLNLSEDAEILTEKTNVSIWGSFVSTTMKASVHLGPNYNENLVACRNSNFQYVFSTSLRG